MAANIKNHQKAATYYGSLGTDGNLYDMHRTPIESHRNATEIHQNHPKSSNVIINLM